MGLESTAMYSESDRPRPVSLPAMIAPLPTIVDFAAMTSGRDYSAYRDPTPHIVSVVAESSVPPQISRGGSTTPPPSSLGANRVDDEDPLYN